MAITINGSGTITGISAGGYPDGTVTEDDLASTLDLSGKTVTLPSGTGGKFDAYAVICDQKDYNVGGGTFTAGNHIQRDLNTELFDPDGIVTIDSNEFTVAAGNYLIVWKAPGFAVGRHTSRLRDITGTMTSVEGASAYSHASYGTQSDSWGWARVTPTASNTYQIRHRCETTKTSNGLGVDTSFANDSKYTVVWIFREA